MKRALRLNYNKRLGDKYYTLPQKDVDKIYHLLDGNNGNAIKLITVLLGSKSGFAPSVKWICDRTGMSKSSYYRARDYLQEKEIIYIDENEIKINI